ncbi:MAG TPA: hypothetical protein VND45_11565 [Thermoanaerobaculia bacterium]|nr:hypothetical protein [Thermoanaerobaculia bacterium]
MTFFIRGDFGTVGNFEVVTENPLDAYSGFIHRWRDNNAPGLPWNMAGQFFRRRLIIRKPALIQHLGTRKLHVVALVTSGASRFIGHSVRENNPTWAWSEPEPLPSSETYTYSGNPVIAQYGGFLEVYAPIASGGWVRWQRNDLRWVHVGVYQIALGRIDALAFTITRGGHFEMLIRRGSVLAHTARAAALGESGWSAPRTLFTAAVGTPSIIQSRFGRTGNLEVLTANANGGITGLWADNDAADAPRWSAAFDVAARFGDPGDAPSHEDEVALVQSSFGTTGNFEVLARRRGKTDFFWRIDTPPWTWSGPFRIASDPPDAGMLLRRTDTLERRLSGCQDLRNSIVWETATGERRPYDAWTRAQKDRLNDFFARIVADAPDLGVRCPNASANLSLSAPSGFPVMFLTAEEAFDLYAAHVAHVFYLEATGAVPWSILDLPALEVGELLWSDRYHTRILDRTPPAAPYYPSHIRPNRDFQQPSRMVTDVTGVACDPRVAWRFLRGIRSTSRWDKLGATEEETVANLTWWFARNVGHGGPPHDFTREAWLRRNLLQDRLRTERRDFGFSVATLVWASYGCHSAAALMHDLARGANIPLLVGSTINSGAHAGLVFRFQRSGTRVMTHADDMYAVQTAPFFPIGADGTRLPEAEHPRAYYEAMWTPFADLPRYGWTHAADYELAPLPFSDRPNSKPVCGTWASIEQGEGQVLDKRFFLGSWRAFIERHCSGVLSAADYAAASTRPARPIAELQSRAAAVAAAWGGCEAIYAAVPSWEPSRGADSWTDT